MCVEIFVSITKNPILDSKSTYNADLLPQFFISFAKSIPYVQCKTTVPIFMSSPKLVAMHSLCLTGKTSVGSCISVLTMVLISTPFPYLYSTWSREHLLTYIPTSRLGSYLRRFLHEMSTSPFFWFSYTTSIMQFRTYRQNTNTPRNIFSALTLSSSVKESRLSYKHTESSALPGPCPCQKFMGVGGQDPWGEFSRIPRINGNWTDPSLFTPCRVTT